MKQTLLAAAVALACGCTQLSPTQVNGGGNGGCVGAACRTTAHGGNVGGATRTSSAASASSQGSSGGSTGVGTTNPTGSAGGSSSSGGTTGLPALLACPNDFHPNCPDVVCNAIYDYSSGAAEPNVLLSLFSPNGVPMSGGSSQYKSLGDGSFYLCPPVNTPFYIEASASGYQTSDTAILVEPGGPDVFFDWFGQFAVIESTLLPAFQGFLSPPAAPGTSIIAVSVSGDQASCNNGVGYTVSAALPDGGTLADGGPLPFNVMYVNGSFPDSSLTATAAGQWGGSAIVYNIDSTLTNGVVVVTVANPNVVPSCLTPKWSTADLTGLVPVSQGSFSDAVVPVLP